MRSALPRVRQSRFPLWLKIVYTLFLCTMVPIYWRSYGPADFLWFCDVAALLTCVALWLESPLLAGINAIAMVLPQTIWILDFVSGAHILGISGYMFDSGIPLYVRGLSTFHIWLPFLLVWMVWRLGYDRRSAWMQTIVCTAVLVASFLLTDPRHPPARYPDAAVNVNRVFGPKATQVQHWMPEAVWLLLQIAFYPICFYLPSHFIFRALFAKPAGESSFLPFDERSVDVEQKDAAGRAAIGRKD